MEQRCPDHGRNPKPSCKSCQHSARDGEVEARSSQSSLVKFMRMEMPDLRDGDREEHW